MQQLNEAAYELDKKRVDGWLMDVVEQSHQEFSLGELKRAIASNTHQLYYSKQGGEVVGIIIVTTTDYVTGRCLVVVGGAGSIGWSGEAPSREYWENLHSDFRELAKSYRCKTMELNGRIGFLRKLKQFGWSEKYTKIQCNM